MAMTAIFLEEGKQTPADVAGRLAEFLAAARTSLHLAIYDCRLSDGPARPVIQALEERAAAGVDVRIVYDAGKPANAAALGVDPAPPGTVAFMKRIAGNVQTKAITGGHNHNPRLMHHKYIVRDGATSGGTVWTGSTNFTDDSWALQENNIVCIDSPELCALYERDFAELWARGDIDMTGARDRGTVHVGSTVVSATFAPGDGPAIDHEIARRIGGARRRLKICSMLITSGGILALWEMHYTTGASRSTAGFTTARRWKVFSISGTARRWSGKSAPFAKSPPVSPGNDPLRIPPAESTTSCTTNALSLTTS